MIEAFLIDECFSPNLVAVALDRGRYATHIVYLGLSGTADLDLMPAILEGNFIFVTNNASDFLKLYRAVEIHPGLIVILPSVEQKRQIWLFERALDALERHGDLINKVLEVDETGNVSIYEWPPAISEPSVRLP